MKSDIEIAKFVRAKIIESGLMKSVSGKLSDRGRPEKSCLEDVVIAVLANEGAGQVQQAYVNVNVYVKDTWNEKTKAWEQDTPRVGEVCSLCKFLFCIHGDGYMAFPSESSQKVNPTGATFEDGHTEHFVNNKILLRICNEE